MAKVEVAVKNFVTEFGITILKKVIKNSHFHFSLKLKTNSKTFSYKISVLDVNKQ
jgi:hypothetical protein